MFYSNVDTNLSPTNNQHHPCYLLHLCVSLSSDKLREERDLWEGAAFSLAQQVLKKEEGEGEGGTLALRTLRRLQLGEKAWSQLARHFTALFHQTDIKQVYTIEWRKKSFESSA